MGAKVWGTAAVVIAAAAAAGAGIITWEGRVWDEHAQDLASYKEAPVKTVIFTETARTWRTRAFYGGSGTPQWPQNGLAGRC